MALYNYFGDNSISAVSTNYYSDSSISSEQKEDMEKAQAILKDNLTGIFGMPYQFLATVDRRIPDTHIGRKYSEKIIGKMPLLFLTPCEQVFMPGFAGDDRDNVLRELLMGNDNMNLNLGDSGRYYTVKFAYDKYAKFVNSMCTQLAYFLGIGNETIDGLGKKGTKLKDINWNEIKNSSFNDYFSASNAAVFYLDGLVSLDESFNNGTMESSLASKINGYTDQANELRFLLGDQSALTALAETAADWADSLADGLSGLTDTLAGGMLSDLSQTGIQTVIHGGKIVFPKIWQDSSFSRSYSFSIKLRSPDHDSVSIFLNLLVPYIHLLAMTLPRGNTEDPNSYLSPFLVKAYCKGMFNVDMGIITDLSVTRGAECQWNDDGLPTQIDINITIEDLYSSLFMSAGSGNVFDAYAVAKNTAMVDFLANMAGLNIAETEILRREKLFGILVGSETKRIDNRIYNKFDTAISNLLAKIYR